MIRSHNRATFLLILLRNLGCELLDGFVALRKRVPLFLNLLLQRLHFRSESLNADTYMYACMYVCIMCVIMFFCVCIHACIDAP